MIDNSPQYVQMIKCEKIICTCIYTCIHVQKMLGAKKG